MTAALPKPERHRVPKYLKWVRTQPCCICLGLGIHAHHLSTRGAGGSDYTAVPLCFKHHHEIHILGDRTFGDHYAVNLWEIAHGLVVKWFTERG